MGLTLIQLVTLPHCSPPIWITRPREAKKQRVREGGRETLDHVRRIRGGDRDDGARGEDETRLLADAVVSNEAVRSVSTDQLKKPRAESRRRAGGGRAMHG